MFHLNNIFGSSICRLFQAKAFGVPLPAPVASRKKADKRPENRLKKKDRLLIVSELIDKGLFLLKGAVNEVSLKLNSSEATIYRYLNEIETNRE